MLSATRFLTDLERRTLRQDLLPLGLQNLFFPVTMVDLLDALTANPAAALDTIEQQGREALQPLCTVHGDDRFAHRFVPLDARGALRARWNPDTQQRRIPADSEQLAASNLPPLETELERFLVEGRGQAQLHHLAHAVHRLHEEAQRRAEVDRATADTSLGELLLDAGHEATEVLEDGEALAAHIVTDFSGGALEIPTAGSKEAVDPIERWFSVAMGAALLSPGAMAAGWAQGYEGALKGAAGRIGVRIAILAIGALLGPVGWAGLVLYLVSDAVLLVLTGGGQLRRLRTQVAENLAGQLVAQVDAGQEALEASIVDGFEPLRQGLVDAAQAEAEAVRTLLEHTVRDRDVARRSAQQRLAQWRQALSAFTDTDTALRDLLHDLAPS